MALPPKPDEMKKAKSWNNKNWHWCSKETGGKCQGRWTIHNPEDFRSYIKREEARPKAKLSHAAQAVMQEEDSECCESANEVDDAMVTEDVEE